jgi:hypothetical protein
LCSVCLSGFYGNPPSKNCQSCPQDNQALQCPENSTIPFVKSGFFRSLSDPGTVFVCIPSQACIATGYALATTCSTGYSGYLCGECEVNFYRSDKVCRQCPSIAIQVLSWTGGIVLILVLLVRIFNYNLTLSSDIRILLQFIQLVALYPNISSKWPTAVLQILRLFSISNFDIEFFAPECAVRLSFWRQFYFKIAIPFFLATCCALTILLSSYVQKFRGYKFSLRKRVSKLITLLSFLILSCFTFLLSTVVSPFICEAQRDGSFTMIHYPVQKCYDSQWWNNIGGAVVLMILVCLVLPISLCVFFLINRTKITIPEFQQKYGLLVRPYRLQYFWWEMMILLKRCFIVFMSEVTQQSSASYAAKFLIAILILFAFTAVDLYCVPYVSGQNVFAIT